MGYTGLRDTTQITGNQMQKTNEREVDAGFIYIYTYTYMYIFLVFLQYWCFLGGCE